MFAVQDKKCPISGESEEEERINYITHLFGLIISFVGCIYLFLYTLVYHDFTHFISCSVYGVTLVLLYAASTYYHKCQNLDVKKYLKTIDHVCIYLLIAGSYTPFTAGPLKDSGGLELLYLVWTIAVIGSFYQILVRKRSKILSTLSYVLMGWLILFNFPSLLDKLSPDSMTWLLAGGFAYTLGTVFYIWDKLPYNHAIWHLFVLGGSACHYCSILQL